jgi:hypothetical protein
MADPRPIGYWLRLVDRLVNDQFERTLDEHGVTRVQWQLLNVLAGGAASVTELDAAVSPYLAAEGGLTTVEHISELIDSGWINETQTNYELTERGHGARDRLSNVVAGQRTDMVEGVTEVEYVATVKTLEQVARNLGWSDEK